mgnify:CR=1 FL=1
MKNPKPFKTKLNYFLITLGICALLCFAYAAIAGIFQDYQTVIDRTNWNIKNEIAKNTFILTNAFFSVGVICTAFGLLVLAANGGAFEMLIYGMRRFFSLFQKDPTKVKFKTFADYHAYHSEQEPSAFSHFIIVGLTFVGISMIFLAIYFKYNV